MNIAQVAPLYESVPPKMYGGTERVVSYLTEELVRQGHNVTLFASGDSVTNAHLISPIKQSLRLNRCIDPIAHHITLAETVLREAHRFDVIHFHIDYLHFPLFRRTQHPFITTLHGRLDISDLFPLFEKFCDIPVTSISHSQRTPLPWVNWIGTVYHGLPHNLYKFQEGDGEYLAFLGRICPEKGVDRAIHIAKRTGIPLRIAAKVDKVDQRYFEESIKPLLQDPLIDFIGEIGEKEKEKFLGQAKALLFPIDWPEPFGLVMIEALACGTPVIAYNCGSVPEVLEPGVTGFIVRNMEDAVRAVEKLHLISRKRCRKIFEERFTASQMAEGYISLYKQVIRQARPMAAA